MGNEVSRFCKVFSAPPNQKSIKQASKFLVHLSSSSELLDAELIEIIHGWGQWLSEGHCHAELKVQVYDLVFDFSRIMFGYRSMGPMYTSKVYDVYMRDIFLAMILSYNSRVPVIADHAKKCTLRILGLPYFGLYEDVQIFLSMDPDAVLSSRGIVLGFVERLKMFILGDGYNSKWGVVIPLVFIISIYEGYEVSPSSAEALWEAINRILIWSDVMGDMRRRISAKVLSLIERNIPSIVNLLIELPESLEEHSILVKVALSMYDAMATISCFADLDDDDWLPGIIVMQNTLLDTRISNSLFVKLTDNVTRISIAVVTKTKGRSILVQTIRFCLRMAENIMSCFNSTEFSRDEVVERIVDMFLQILQAIFLNPAARIIYDYNKEGLYDPILKQICCLTCDARFDTFQNQVSEVVKIMYSVWKRNFVNDFIDNLCKQMSRELNGEVYVGIKDGSYYERCFGVALSCSDLRDKVSIEFCFERLKQGIHTIDHPIVHVSAMTVLNKTYQQAISIAEEQCSNAQKVSIICVSYQSC
eukprot:TRINITY_DN4876_c0_g1_i11.p1 TRINITY_DN4876_c0_g1~~TRINITY_DN4876_c0_g1_i11.p1  ORF type:complete len:531 (+),score=79.80 TRINITY_DN4876_c0_g1_i11:48-1640(+)